AGVAGGLWYGAGGLLKGDVSFDAVSALKRSLPFTRPSPPPLKGRAQVLTGDIIRIGGETIALDGVDAPELTQRCRRARRRWRCGIAARRALQALTARKTLTCNVVGRDGFARKSARCFVGPVELNTRLIARGHVFASQNAPSRYRGVERDAKAGKRGIWAGTAVRPAAFRDRLWKRAEKRAPGGCPIKGDVTAKGKVYVLPWDRRYRRVRVRKARGERWFCSEAEARSAGWRRL
ncbi:MAG: thermonuclease family protein, partial [Pseudomonadota bacterium]